MKKTFICVLCAACIAFAFAEEPADTQTEIITEAAAEAVEESAAKAVSETTEEPALQEAQETEAVTADTKAAAVKESDDYDDGSVDAKQAKRAKVNPEKEADTYEDAPVQKTKKDDKPKTEKEIAEEKALERQKRIDNFGSSGNWAKDFFLGKDKYAHYDTVQLATGTLLGIDVKPREAELIYNPKTDMSGVATYYQTNYYEILWDAKTRQGITDALAMYLKDFEAKKLIRNSNLKTRRLYLKNGKSEIQWGTLKIFCDNKAKCTVEAGYEFKNKSPYFCIIIKQGKNIAENIGTNVPRESTEVQLYFTKAQAKAFVDLISNEAVARQREAYYNYINGKADEGQISDSY